MKLTPFYVRVIGYVLLAAIIIGLFFWWMHNRENSVQILASAEQGVRTSQATSGIAQDAGVVQGVIDRGEEATASARNDYQRGYEDAKRNDPTVAPWGAQPVPQRLRDLARERRLARERLGCAGSGCPDDDGATRK